MENESANRFCDENPVNRVDPSGHGGELAELVLDMSIRVSIYASAITPYAIYSAAALGTLYIATRAILEINFRIEGRF